MGISRIMVKMLAPQHFSDICHPHRGTWMSRFRLLHGIHTQYSNGISQLFLLIHVSLSSGKLKEASFDVYAYKKEES
jgi:hypothetical protein